MRKTSPFEKFAARYDEWFAKNKPAYESELQALKAVLPTRGKGVEIGVGTGRFSAPFGIWIGLDPSRKMVQMAKSRGVQVIEGVAEAPPFKDRAFEFVLMVTTICFLDDILASFREAHRILVAGGRLIVDSSTEKALSACCIKRKRRKTCSTKTRTSIPWMRSWTISGRQTSVN